METPTNQLSKRGSFEAHRKDDLDQSTVLFVAWSSVSRVSVSILQPHITLKVVRSEVLCRQWPAKAGYLGPHLVMA